MKNRCAMHLLLVLLSLQWLGSNAMGDDQSPFASPPSIERTVELHFRAGVPELTDEKLLDLINRFAEQDGGVPWGGEIPTVLSPARQNEPLPKLSDVFQRWSITLIDRGQDGATITLGTQEPKRERILDETIALMKKAIADAPAGDAQQLRDRIAAIDKQVSETRTEERQIEDLMQLRVNLMQNLDKEKFQTLALEEQKIEVDLAAKEARAAAIREQIKAIDQQATTRTADDPVTKQLREAVKLRENALVQLQQMYQKGLTGGTELNAGRVALADAKTKLVEREEALKQSVNGDLLSRLVGDLVLTSIDQAELRARMAAIKKKLPPEDFNNLTLEQLHELNLQVAKGRGIPTTRPALLVKLRQQEDDLLAQKFGLLVSDLKLVSAPATRPGR